MGGSFFSTIWMFVLPLVAIIVPVWVGQRYGLHIKKKGGEINDAPISSAVAAALGLLAFMLAFTFQIVGNRLDNRKALLLTEISDIRTAYQCAGLVPEPIRSQTRQKILRYVDIRVDFLHNRRGLPEVMTESRSILDSLWSFSEQLAAVWKLLILPTFEKGRFEL